MSLGSLTCHPCPLVHPGVCTGF